MKRRYWSRISSLHLHYSLENFFAHCDRGAWETTGVSGVSCLFEPALHLLVTDEASLLGDEATA